jgi:hypothetical protein
VEYTPRLRPFNWYEISIRWCYYTIVHTESGFVRWSLMIPLMALMIPFVIYYRITGKMMPDLELL